MKSTRSLFLAAGLSLLAAPAYAHIGVGDTSSFAAGIAHPLLGLDHLLVMIAVGAWAALKGGRALWAWPVAFVSVMLIGGGLAMADVAAQDDAFFDKAIEGFLMFAFNQGEVCTCPSRALIQENIYDRFMEMGFGEFDGLVDHAGGAQGGRGQHHLRPQEAHQPPPLDREALGHMAGSCAAAVRHGRFRERVRLG